jgi:hypothetical protein
VIEWLPRSRKTAQVISTDERLPPRLSQYDVTASHHLIITVIYGDPRAYSQGFGRETTPNNDNFWAFIGTLAAHALVYSRLLFIEATALPVALSGPISCPPLVEFLSTSSSFSTSHSSIVCLLRLATVPEP